VSTMMLAATIALAIFLGFANSSAGGMQPNPSAPQDAKTSGTATHEMHERTLALVKGLISDPAKGPGHAKLTTMIDSLLSGRAQS
jgi:hypothetical protein